MNWTSVCFDWNRARAFLVTAEEGSLSAAAKALNMTQPTLSRQVAALEQELGVMLFERTGQRLELTQSGLELLEHARRMGEAAQAFSLAAQGQSQTLEGTVVISVSEPDAVYRLPNIIAQLRKAEPGIHIETVVTNQVSDLKRREADIAIRSFRPTQPDLIARKLGEELIWLYGTEDYLQPYADIQTLDELQDIEIIGFNRTDAMIAPLNQQGWNLSLDNIKLVTSFQPMQISLCHKGLGLIYLPDYIGDNDPKLKRAFPSFGPILRLPIWLVCHQELRTNPRVRRVYDFIANSIGQH
ncbi:transcriptional regulator, LysR family [Oceanospirillum multiglobuliferum]|uniref:LysR family transcriptional regulator n=1 Tax=Oceanospirillum multiglobuliferum TaxID=64969 RepID=A0A1T4QIY6_9GAMM|nr:LysR family transcriptional regulator [Oceanospirillum multiglobuliferum]OPX56395.1 LysR family transcriptional regulator [Oceanospirillum multiglobuliferum]SKA03654.1 transcriptional regulator, LysR family [Oceanospirillum multiglobuliferum]